MTTLLAKALYDNVAETADELSFRKGDIMVVMEQDTAGLQGWWLCSLHGRQGIVPGNRVKLLEAGVSYQLGPRRDLGAEAQPRSPPPPRRPSKEESVYRSPVPVKDDWVVYQVPPRFEPLGLYRGAVEAQEVYQVPLAHSCPKPLPQGCAPKTQETDYLIPDVQLAATRTPRGKMAQPEEEMVYVVPPCARLCLSPPVPAAVPPLQEEIYKVPRALAGGDPGPQEVYNHPLPLRDPLRSLQTPSDVYDTPTSFGKKVARVAPQPVPPSSAESAPEEIPEDIYDVPPAFQKLAEEVLEEEEEEEEEVYAAPSNLKRASALLNLYEVPEDVLCAEVESSIYDVPAMALEDPGSPSVSFHRLSISSAGSSRSKSSVESGSGRDGVPPPSPMVKELVVDVVSALETLARLHQSLQSLLANFGNEGTGRRPSAQGLEAQDAVEPLRESLKDFIGFAQVAVMGSTQASDPTLHQRLAKHLELLEDALRNLPRCGMSQDPCGGRRTKGSRTPVKASEPSPLAALALQISENSASVAGLVQSNANILFQRPRLPSNESLSRRPLPALPTQLSAERIAADVSSPAFVRKGSIQDRPLPPPPPVFTSGKAEQGHNEYEGIQLTEEYDYVHLKGSEKPRSRTGSIPPPGNLPQQNGQPKTDPPVPENIPTTPEALSPETPELEGIVHDQQPTVDPGGGLSGPSLEDLQLLQFYAGQCQGHYATLLAAIDSFFASVRGNQPPKVFISHGKFVIVTAHKLVFIGDTLSRLLASQDLRAQVTACGNSLCQALKVVVLATKGAALQYPSLPAVQDMVDRVTELSCCALTFSTLLSRLAI